MKNAPLSALVLFGIAGLVGGVTWFATSHERIEGEAMAVEPSAVATPKVIQVTPKEKKLKWRLEQAQKKLDQYKKDGVTLESGVIKTRDPDGSALYVYPELVEGVDRYGEPKFLMATYKRRDPVPFVKEPRQAPKNARMHITEAPPGTIKFAKKPESTGGAGADASGGSGDGDGDGAGGPGQSGGGGDKPNKPSDG